MFLHFNLVKRVFLRPEFRNQRLKSAYLLILRPPGFVKVCLPTWLECISIWRAARQCGQEPSRKSRWDKNISQVQPAWLLYCFWRIPRLIGRTMTHSCICYALPYLEIRDLLNITLFYWRKHTHFQTMEWMLWEEKWFVQCHKISLQ